MKRILLVTDAWKPQVNGLITVFNNLLPVLEKRGYEVKVIEPSQFSTIPLPKYSEIRLSLLPKKKIQRILADYKPDAVHIFAEGKIQRSGGPELALELESKGYALLSEGAA
jgi:hypothetical protein